MAASTYTPKEGVITQLFDDGNTGVIKSGTVEYAFYYKGAKETFNVDDEVDFTEVKFPGNRGVVVVDPKRKL